MRLKCAAVDFRFSVVSKVEMLSVFLVWGSGLLCFLRGRIFLIGVRCAQNFGSELLVLGMVFVCYFLVLFCL